MSAAISKILVPVDFSNASRAALEYAQDLARRLNASIHVLHVVDDTATAGLLTEAYIGLSTLRQNRRCEARHQMNALLAMLHGVAFTDEVSMGNPAQMIALAAADQRADLIVMGTHGRTGLAHALLGSVAERVIRVAPCPVLTVRDSARRRATEVDRYAATPMNR